nr:ABC transporter permease subunit [Tissierella praeacuta]
MLPLTLAATCFIGRALENTYKGVDPQLIEAAKSFGASDLQVVFRVIVKESIPGVVSIATMSTINYIAGSTIAGAVGGGGIGAIALNYGYQSFNNSVLYTSVFILFLMVQVTQTMGNWLYKKSL